MLGSYSAAVVTGGDPLAAANVAIGIGLAEAEHRRVAIGDLVGEIEPIQSLVTGGDPHGISDSFIYGVSLNKIAQSIDTTGNLFVMPSGTGSVADPEIFRNSRWQRLANGFREVGALLIIVAPADAPALRELIDQMDGVVLVGRSQLDTAPYMPVLARVPSPVEQPLRKPAAPPKAAPLKIALYVILLLLLVAAGIYWRYMMADQANHATPAFRHPAPADTQKAAVPATPADTMTLAPPANPQDSASATAFTVEIAAFSAPEDAMNQLRQHSLDLPAGTVAPVPIGSSRITYYKLLAGAFATRSAADKFLTTLQQKQIVAGAPGSVVQTPYALLLDSAGAGQTQKLVQKYAGSGQPVYVLVQPNGSLKLYAGAFERPEDSATLTATLRAAHFNPVLVYRTGRLP
jgi:hypothetical protein